MVELLKTYGVAFVALSAIYWLWAAPACLSVKPRHACWNRSYALRLYFALMAGGLALVAIMEVLKRAQR